MRAEQTRYSMPGWGVGELWTSPDLVLAHDFHFAAHAGVGHPVSQTYTRSDVSQTHPPKGARRPPSGTVPGNSARVVHEFVPNGQRAGRDSRRLDPLELVERCRAFFAGEDVAFDDVPLDLSSATPFQHAVATALRAVPRGEVVSYGELAALAGYPGAQRAVGTFCARNRFMLLLPCHRVVGADGIGGYGSAGTGVKRRLLAIENVLL